MPPTSKPDQAFRTDEAGRYVIPSGATVVLEPGAKVVLAGAEIDLPDLPIDNGVWAAEVLSLRCNEIVGVLRRAGLVGPDRRAEAEARQAEEVRRLREQHRREREATSA
jgi:hypothetical protein